MAWTITNSGVINAGTSGNGIQLGDSSNYVGASVITNTSGGTIAGKDGISVFGSAASSIVNQSGATISASLRHAVTLYHAGTITNSGVIIAPTATNTQGGILMEDGGVIINNAGGTISGYRGVLLNGTGTLTNSGTIKAATTSGHAVAFNGGGANRMIVNPGAVFVGSVHGGSGTLELKSAASGGTLAMTNFTGFNTVTLDASSIWTIIGGTTALSGAIQGFASSDVIDLTGFVAVSETFASNKLVLTDTSNAHATLNIQGSFNTAANFGLSIDGSGGTDIGFQALPGITAGGTVSFTGGGSPISLDSGLTVTDPSANLAGATIAIASGFIAGDTLHFTDQNGITGSFNSVTGTLSLSGTASLLNYQTALESISYSFIPTTGDPTHAGGDTSRTITWVVSDGSAVSNTGTSKLQTTFAPVLAYGQTIDEAGIIANSETVSIGVMTLRNNGVSVGTIAVGNSLGTGAFILVPDGTGGTDVIESTVFGTYATGVTLSVNPTTIASTASIDNGGTGPAVFGGATYTVVNYGTVTATGTGTSVGNPGIYLSGNGSTLDNYGTITATGNAAEFYGTGSLINSGILSAGHWGLVSRGLFTVYNTGTISGISDGIDLFGGGLVTNSNQIIGANGLRITGAAGAVINSGTINATYGTAIDIASGGTVSNTGSGLITAPGLYAAIAIAGGAGTVVNAGQIIADAAGVYLGAGGSVSNQSGGTITSYQGVYANTIAAAVTNAGSIGGNETSGRGSGVWLQAGGTLTNFSTGLITGNYAVVLQGGLAAAVNAGTITGNTTNGAGSGVYSNTGGLVTNQSGGVITGFLGVWGITTALTVVNAGSIGGNDTVGGNTIVSGITVGGAAGVLLAAGGSVTNQSGGTISGYYGVRASSASATVVNAGVIAGNYTSNYQHADGVYLSAGGAVTNQASGIIYARSDGVLIAGGRGTVVNLGTIHSHIGGYGGSGVSLDAGGVIINGASGGTASSATILGYNYAIQFGTTGTDTLMNYGSVYGPTGTVAVAMHTGTVINGASGATGALIKSGLGATAVQIAGVGTVVNYGTINGNAVNGSSRVAYGVSIGGNGSVASTISNLGTAAVIQGYVAVYAAQNATVTNAGTMAVYQTFGGSIPLYAVVFGGGTNRLIIDPGAVFNGIVNGSGPATVAPGGNTIVLGTANGIGTTTLELASAATAGTLSGLGTKYVGFAAVTIDSVTNWTFSGSNTLASGVTLTDSGTFTNAGLVTGSAKGVTLAASARITNQSGGTIAGSSIGVSASGAGTVVNAGVIGGNQTVSSASGISFAAGGSVTNQSGGTIRGARAISEQTGTLTVLNAGSIIGGSGASRSGIALNGSGTISNQSSGVITGNYGIIAYASGATITNAGSISGVYAVLLNAAGRLTNQSGGIISGSSEGVLFNAAATVTNAGTITGVGYGVQLAAGGTLIAQSGGIISSAGTAVSFATSRTNRLVVYQGASFTGRVDGGNTIGAASISSLELASNASAGTLTSLGSQFTHFARVTIDAGAQWVLGGTQSGFGTLTNAGSLGGTSGYGIKVGTSATGVTVVNQSGGVITGTTDAVFVITGSGAGTVTNSGKITGGAAGFAGINLSGGGRVSNASGGTITGLSAGVFIANGSGATVSNAGSIGSSQFYGVWLLNGGTVTNASGGVITGSYSGPAALIKGYIGVVGLQNDTVINAGTIASYRGSVAGAYAVALIGGTNRLKMYPGATFIGTVSGGGPVPLLGGSYVLGSVTTSTSTLELASASAIGTLRGLGTAFVNFANATIDHGAQWLLAGSNTLHSGETLTNAGTLIDTGTFTNAGRIVGTFGSSIGGGTVAISVALSGILSNSATGAITGAAGIDSNVGAGGPGGHGVSLTTGSVINQGTITGGGGGNSGGGGGGGIGGGGVVVGAGGLSNTTSGLISGGAGGRSDDDPPGGNGGAGVTVTGGSVTNTGTIIGGIAGQGSGPVANGIGGFGVNLIGGVVVNQGTITGGGGAGLRASYASFSGYGVRVLGGTLINAGVIGGGSGFNAGGTAFTADAVLFGGAARMIVVPGASFVGLVAANTEALDVLELASSGSAGTIAGLGTSITNFASLVFDAGARWAVAGNASASGLGTLGITGFAVGDTIDLTGFVAVSETFAGNQLVLTDSNTAHATLAIQGNFASSNFNIANGVSADTDITFNLIYGQTIDDVGIIATSETVVSGVMTLSNGGSTVGTILVGNSLSTGDFSLAPDGLTTGTNVIVHTATGSYSSGVTLTVNPSTIGSSATINVATLNGSGVYGPSGTPWVLTNQGHVSETGGTKASGVKFAGSGTIINAASATITSAGLGILLVTGGNVSNQSGGTISGGVSGIMELAAGTFTLVNNGYLAGHDTTVGRGVMAASPGASIINQMSGTILGHMAVQTTGTSASVYNAGVIGDEPTTHIGIYLKAGGTITNALNGAISGNTAIVASGTDTATVVNAGSIGGNSISGTGVELGSGGTITNQSKGTISGGADAVTLAAGHVNRLVIDPGAVFTSTVDGGNAIGDPSVSTLELASGGSMGTLSGLAACRSGIGRMSFC